MGKKKIRRPTGSGVKTVAKTDEAARATPTETAPRLRTPSEWMVILGTALALAVVFFVFALDQPYHLDTTAYFRSVRDLRAGHLTCGYGTRCMVSYFLIPFALFGERAVKVGFVAAAALFFLFSYLFAAKVFSRASAYVATLLQLFIPCGLITVTHLKEDFVGLMFLALALFLATRPVARWRILSAIAFAFSLLSKESLLLYAPFFLSIYGYYLFGTDLGLAKRTARDRRTWFWLAGGVAIVVAVTVSIKHDYLRGLASLTNSPYLGQFKGPFSSLLPAGFELYRRGFGVGVVFWMQLLGILLFALEKDRPRRILFGIFAANTVLVALFSMNNTVMTYRNFVVVAFLTLPMAVRAVELLVPRRWQGLAAAAAAVAVLAVGAKSYPYVAFHAHYNPQARFFGDLEGAIAPDSVLLSMDYAGLAKHYTGLETLQHDPDPDEAQARSFVGAIKGNTGKTYYLLPDALAYDAKNTLKAKMEAEFRVASAFQGWFEDYHGMDYGYSPSELQSKLEQQSGCRVSYVVEGGSPIDSLATDLYRYRMECEGGTKDASYTGYKGKVFTTLTHAHVYRLVGVP